MKNVLFLCLVAVLCVGVSQAAVINWQNVLNSSTSDVSQVSTRGTLVEAGNLAGTDIEAEGYVVNPLVNGVQFTHVTDLLSQDHSKADFNPAGAGNDYDELLSTLDYSPTADSVELAVGLLTPGQLYEIQIWYTDGRIRNGAPRYGTRYMYFDDGHGNVSGGVNAVGVLEQGQFVKGVFTANIAQLNLNITAEGTDDAHMNAYQIREVPEPATMVLLGMGSLLVLRRRKA